MLTKSVAYTYDGLNRLVARKLDSNGDGTVDSTQRFVYDGSTEAVLVLDGGSNVTDRLLYGPAVDQVFADEGGSGVVSWLLTDNLGSVRDVARYNSGTATTSVVDSLDYDSFGQVVTETSAANTSLLKYTGKYLDPDTGNQLHGERWLKPRTGRWLNPDPSGFTAGDANLYRYTGNGPTNFTDPTGLWQRATGGPGLVAYPPDFVGPLPPGKAKWGTPEMPFDGLPHPPEIAGDRLYWGGSQNLWENALAVDFRLYGPHPNDYGMAVLSKENQWRRVSSCTGAWQGSEWQHYLSPGEEASLLELERWLVREAREAWADSRRTYVSALDPNSVAGRLAALDPNDPDYWRKYLIVTGNYGLLMLGPDGVAYELAGLGAGAAAGRSQGVRFGYPFGGRGYGRTSPPYTGGPIWPILGGRPPKSSCSAAVDPSKPLFPGGHSWGNTKPPTAGANPNSLYTHIDLKTGRAVQNAIYDSNGNVIGHVDFKDNGRRSPPGHWHQFPTPGNPASGHGPGKPHNPPSSLPPGWGQLPPGVQPFVE